MNAALLKIGLAGAVLVAALVYHQIDRAAAVAEGRAAERADILKAAVERLQERDSLNGNVRDATAADICARLGGRMLENGECG